MLAAGDTFKLFNAATYVGSFATITPSPGPGLIWDASQLAVNGTLSVKVSDVDTGSYFHDAAKRAKEGKLYDQGFMDKLSQMYGLVEGVVEANKVGWSPVNGEVVALGQNQTAAGMTGKCSGIRVKISRELAMQLAAV